ncbi:sensor histidine kinase, partial [Actinomadura adrarensis]
PPQQRRVPDDGAIGPGERRALSRDLHDRVAQAIAAGLNGLQLSEHYHRGGRSECATDKWLEACSTLRQALELTKEMATRLRFAAPEHDSGKPSGGRAEANKEGDGVPIVSAGVAAAGELFLVLREAIDNALTHAEAETITIRLSVEREAVVVSVEDDGGGIARDMLASPASLGLRSMRERAELLGGTFRLTTATPEGTRVDVTVPRRAW